MDQFFLLVEVNKRKKGLNDACHFKGKKYKLRLRNGLLSAAGNDILEYSVSQSLDDTPKIPIATCLAKTCNHLNPDSASDDHCVPVIHPTASWCSAPTYRFTCPDTPSTDERL
ncbi:hypothetical protein AVEN_2892-1 [Araneus ventricosus]|uniref:Uncharacterized protein n=1 Tax=Araneus ventricosus TaxID=182803 RepID=A0A4Y2N752_ARAVE|nr:hypothetical protein AVEN_2892-1 [Araneus ventricosus]